MHLGTDAWIGMDAVTCAIYLLVILSIACFTDPLSSLTGYLYHGKVDEKPLEGPEGT